MKIAISDIQKPKITKIENPSVEVSKGNGNSSSTKSSMQIVDVYGIDVLDSSFTFVTYNMEHTLPILVKESPRPNNIGIGT